MRALPFDLLAVSFSVLLLLGACGKKAEAPPATSPPVEPTKAAPAAPAPDAEAAVEASPDIAVAPAVAVADTADPTAVAAADAADPSGVAAAADTADQSPVDAACAAIVERSAKARKAIAKAIDAIPEEAMGPVGVGAEDADYGGCVGEGPRAQGTWAFELLGGKVWADSIKKGAEYGAAVEVEVGLVWVGPDGATQSTSTSVVLGFFSSSIAFEQAHDFDRDGRPELIIYETQGSPDHRETQLEFYRSSPAGVERFWKDVQPAVTHLEDVDGDGTLDLMHDGEFAVEHGRNKVAGFSGVTHVAGLDKLERTGAAAKAYYLKKCPAKTLAADFKAGELEAVLVQATCAWLWGEDAGAITAKVAELTRDPELGDDQFKVSADWLNPGNKPVVQLP